MPTTVSSYYQAIETFLTASALSITSYYEACLSHAYISNFSTLPAQMNICTYI